MEDKETKVSKIWEKWKNCVSYMQKKGLFDMVERCVNFVEGNHWGKISPSTKDFPRVTINQTEMIVNSKTSGIKQSKLKITFYSDENPAKAEKLTRFNSYIEKEMKFDEICDSVVDDGGTVGGSPVYFYWDEDAVGKRGEYKGGLRVEQLDVTSLGVENPNELDIQKQKWIIVKTRQEVESVRKLLDKEEDAELIQPDDDEKLNGLIDEQDGSNLCTVLTMFYRINGEVYFEKSTKNVQIHGARPLNPNLVKFDSDKDEETIKENVNTRKYRATLYPIEIYTYKKKKGCIYGRGEVEPIIMNNKAINFSYAMMAKSIEDMGFGQMVAKKGALDVGERISNDPTKLLIDKYTGPGQGFYSVNKQPFPAQVPTAISSIMDSTRSVTGATEVMTGEMMGANQSGTSIAYLQQQAQKPLNKLTERYKRFRERCAEIMAQFYILYYKDKNYTYRNNEEDNFGKNANEVQQNAIAQGFTQAINNNLNTDTFNGEEFEDMDFDILCEAGSGSEWSELTELNMLELALSQGQIDFETFLNAYPPHLITNKQTLLKGIQETKNGALAQATQTIQALQQQLEQCQAYIKQTNQMVNNSSKLIKRNRELEEQISSLQNEYSNKVNTLNGINEEVTQDASEFAQVIYNNQLNKQ